MFQTTVLTLMQELMQRVVVIVFIFDFNSFFSFVITFIKLYKFFLTVK